MKTIQYFDFEPSELIAELGRQKFDDIWEKAPSDAFISAEVQKISENKFRGSLELRAVDLQFLVEIYADSAMECIEQLSMQTMQNIRQWRENRVELLAV